MNFDTHLIKGRVEKIDIDNVEIERSGLETLSCANPICTLPSDDRWEATFILGSRVEVRLHNRLHGVCGKCLLATEIVTAEELSRLA